MPRQFGVWAAIALQCWGASGAARADPATVADASAQGRAEIAAPISIAVNHDLTLASVQLRAAPLLDAAIGPTERVSTASGALLIQQSPAGFVVSADDGQSVSWSVPAIVTLVRIGGRERLAIATAIDTAPGAQRADVLSYSAGQPVSLEVGGRVRVDRATVAGAYQGVLVATAQFN